MSQPGTHPGSVRPEAYKIFGALFKKNNTKLRTKVKICFGSQGRASEGP